MAKHQDEIEELRHIAGILRRGANPKMAEPVEWAISEIILLRDSCNGLSQRAAQAEIEADLIEEVVEAVADRGRTRV